jgi:hypothetical protein
MPAIECFHLPTTQRNDSDHPFHFLAEGNGYFFSFWGENQLPKYHDFVTKLATA